MADQAHTPIRFEDFPDSKLDEFSEQLATGAKIDWPPVTAEKAATSEKVATSSKSPKFRTKKATVATSSTDEVADPKTKKLPRKVAGCYWANNGAGWLLHRSKRDDQNRNPRIGHLSKTNYDKLKREHKGNELTVALTEWAKAKAAEKGIDLNL